MWWVPSMGRGPPNLDLGGSTRPLGAPHPFSPRRTAPSSHIMPSQSCWAVLLLCAAAGVFGWLGLGTSLEVGVPLCVPSETTADDEQFRAEATRCELSPPRSCHHQVMVRLRLTCTDLSEDKEEAAKLGMDLFNCQASAEGHQTYACTPDMGRQEEMQEQLAGWLRPRLETPIHPSLQQLALDETLITSGQHRVAQLMEDITQWMGNTSSCGAAGLREGERVVLSHLHHAQERAQDIYSQLASDGRSDGEAVAGQPEPGADAGGHGGCTEAAGEQSAAPPHHPRPSRSEPECDLHPHLTWLLLCAAGHTTIAHATPCHPSPPPLPWRAPRHPGTLHSPGPCCGRAVVGGGHAPWCWGSLADASLGAAPPPAHLHPGQGAQNGAVAGGAEQNGDELPARALVPGAAPSDGRGPPWLSRTGVTHPWRLEDKAELTWGDARAGPWHWETLGAQTLQPKPISSQQYVLAVPMPGAHQGQAVVPEESHPWPGLLPCPHHRLSLMQPLGHGVICPSLTLYPLPEGF
ncbi:uncharacterized protein LOC142053819 isoform X1 [Phalacrocorax aristotelis]|uniref:uncharacterized protein LOC142053819 isoform X1 n=1 Tax=Phalacrocorax aristotelis TaxID=126867 RepID=UPI003F4BFFF4